MPSFVDSKTFPEFNVELSLTCCLTLNVKLDHMLGSVCIVANDARIVAGIAHRSSLRVDGLVLCGRIENERRNITGPWEGLAILKPANYTKTKETDFSFTLFGFGKWEKFKLSAA